MMLMNMNWMYLIAVVVSTGLTSGFPSSFRRAATSTTTQLYSDSSSSKRQPWDVLRFVGQSAKFVPTPFSRPAQRRMVQPNEFLWRTSDSNDFTFAPLDDVVMGGASSSQFFAKNGTWSGRVTDVNNGGFVGIRTTPKFQWDLSNCRGVELTLRQQSSSDQPAPKTRLKVGFRDSTDFNGIVWTTSLDIASSSTKAKKVKVPLDKLKPTKFAQIVSDVTFDKSNVVGMQLVYSKFEYNGELNPNFKVGQIEIELQEVRSY
mmetsp:Transcript_25974/g.71539  ORF Transcript_25974/g.71539 Transcript_25974/m.71539 type:complete len:260 (+) Transcript_25974:62-841(+)